MSKQKIFSLIAATDADDIQCKDGEVEGADFLFTPEDEGESEGDVPGTPDSPGESDGENGEVEEPKKRKVVTVTRAMVFPSGYSFLAMHAPEGVTASHVIMEQSDGRIVYSSMRLPGVNPLAATPTVWSPVSSTPVAGIVKAVGVNDWLVVLTERGLLYARWDGNSYLWLGESPGAPAAVFRTEAKALPGYCDTPGALPQFVVTVPTPGETTKDVLDWLAGYSAQCTPATRQNIINAVKGAFKEFTVAAQKAGCYLSPVKVATAWKLPDGSYWQMSAPAVTGQEGNIYLRIANADCVAGILYMNLEVNRTPFGVKATMTGSDTWALAGIQPELLVSSNPMDFDADSVSAPAWVTGDSRGFNIGPLPIREEDFDPFPPVLPAMKDYGIPDDIFSIGGRLTAVMNPVTPRRGLTQIIQSDTLLPAVCRSYSRIEGEEVLCLTNSLRSASGSDDLSPLYAFCMDGIRLLDPSAGKLRATRLLSRHIAISRGAFAPLPDGTAFITRSGVVKISGTTVSVLSKNLDYEFDENDSLIYIYKRNTLLLHKKGEQKVWLYSFDTGKWEEGEGRPGVSHYAWPVPYLVIAGELGEGDIEEVTVAAPLKINPMAKEIEETPEPDSPYAIKTRPIKLTDPFTIKKLTEVEAVWPEGDRLPVKVYGALKPGKWYFLGMTTRGRMLMRGSGWRLFRVETFAVKGEKGWIVPTLRFVWEK